MLENRLFHRSASTYTSTKSKRNRLILLRLVFSMFCLGLVVAYCSAVSRQRPSSAMIIDSAESALKSRSSTTNPIISTEHVPPGYPSGSVRTRIQQGSPLFSQNNMVRSPGSSVTTRPPRFAVGEKKNGKKYAVIYRIIGNDLPPRHNHKQSITNLAFILKNEPEFDGVEKIWILNRIHDSKKEETIIELMKMHKKPYIRIPFDLHEYQSIPFKYSHFSQQMRSVHGNEEIMMGDPEDYDGFYSLYYQNMDNMIKQAAMDEMYHFKNLYVMNNNGARNFALKDGRSRGAQWIFPFDGNSYISQNAWDSIVSCLGEQDVDSVKYISVPMVRMTNNTLLLQKEFMPKGNEEPQIIFHWDAKEEFDEMMRYGRRPKVEFLWRVRILGQWDKLRFYPWEHLPRPKTTAEQSNTCGWVARLFSGDHTQEITGASHTRHVRRSQAIRRIIDNIDEEVVKEHLKIGDGTYSWSQTAMTENMHNFWMEHPLEVSLVQYIASVSDAITIDDAKCCLDVDQSLYKIVLETLLFKFTGENSYLNSASHFVKKQFLANDCGNHVFDSPLMPYILDCITILQDAKALPESLIFMLKSKVSNYLEDLYSQDSDLIMILSLDDRNMNDFKMATMALFGDLPVKSHQTIDQSQLRINLIVKTVDSLLAQLNSYPELTVDGMREMKSVQTFLQLMQVGCSSNLIGFIPRLKEELWPKIQQYRNLLEVKLYSETDDIDPDYTYKILQLINSVDSFSKCINPRKSTAEHHDLVKSRFLTDLLLSRLPDSATAVPERRFEFPWFMALVADNAV